MDWMVWLEGWDIWKELHEVDDLLDPISRTVEGPVPEVEAVRTGTMTDSMIVSPDRAVVERDLKDLTEKDEKHAGADTLQIYVSIITVCSFAGDLQVG